MGLKTHDFRKMNTDSEKESRVTTNGNEGLKFDSGKPRFELIPPMAMECVANVITKGAKKYGVGNWTKELAWSRLIGALHRHTNAFQRGQIHDTETGENHMAHVIVNAMYLLEYSEKNKESPMNDLPKITMNLGIAKKNEG